MSLFRMPEDLGLLERATKGMGIPAGTDRRDPGHTAVRHGEQCDPSPRARVLPAVTQITLATVHKAPFDKAPVSGPGNTVTTTGTLLRTDPRGKLRALFGQY